MRPSSRNTNAFTKLVDAFTAWAKEKGASEVRGILLNKDNQEQLANVLGHQGFVRAGLIMVKRVNGDE